jgi:prolyl-tRNA synthetase
MPRTTIDIDANVLRKLKKRQQKEGKSLGSLVSELLAASLQDLPEPHRGLRWKTARMGARVDLEDKDALWRKLDEG